MARRKKDFFGNDTTQQEQQEQQPYDIKSLITDNEQILWQGKPLKKAFVMARIFRMLPFALIWLVFDGIFITFMIMSGIFEQMPWYFLVGIIAFFAVHLIPVWIWIANIVSASAQHTNVDYVFTDKRIIIKSGLVGVDVKNIFYTEINDVRTNVGFIDKMYNVGDIIITANFKVYMIEDIKNPYEVTNRLQKIVLDIKTDTFYPNDLRPKANSGYDTKYKM